MTIENVLEEMNVNLEAGAKWEAGKKIIQDYIRIKETMSIPRARCDLHNMIIKEDNSASKRGLISLFISELSEELGYRLRKSEERQKSCQN